MRTHVTSGILDFPRKKLPESVWRYNDAEPLPKLQPELRALILTRARDALSRFGAKLKGAMLYGGAATYQYHPGGDIDTSLYVDWGSFQGDESILMDVFKTIEIPWNEYVLHLFVKPRNEPQQFEVADAYYDVLHDEWKLPPLILPRDFDPEIFFKPLIEVAERKAQQIDLMMGSVGRRWASLKNALEAYPDARDPKAVSRRIQLSRQMLMDELTDLIRVFGDVWEARKILHTKLRQKHLVSGEELGRYERFQPAEVTWKYLDQSGYVEFLKLLTQAFKSGTITKLLDQSMP